MRDIYLIDFENVASEGLSGITYLSEEDQVIIFYSNNSNRLSMKMHILIGKSVCKLSYFEVSVGGKNALDHQIATWLGYLIGTGAAERNYYIVSRDMGYKHVASFWASSAERAKVRCIENIRAAGRLERRVRERREERPETAQPLTEEPQTKETQETQTQEPAPTGAPETLLPILPQEPEAVEAQPEVTEPQPETAEAQPEATEPQPEAVEVQLSEPEVPVQPEPATAAQEPEATLTPSPIPETPEAEAQPGEDLEAVWEAAEPQGDPEDKPQPKRSYRSRTKFRRGRAKYRETTEPEQKPQEAQEAQETQEAPVTAEPEPEAKRQRGTKTQPKREKRPAKDEGKTPKNLDQLGPLLAPYPKLQESTLRELILSNKRQVLCNTLRKQLGQEKGLALYNEIKKLAWH
jgi:hypothetical protein